MAVVYHEIYLPIDTESTFDYIVIKQGDAGTHKVRATLISNNRVYTIPTSGVSYFMKFRKPDNNYCLVEATVSDNTISAEVTEEMLRVSGTGRGEFMIVSGSDELKTATFHVKIVRQTFTSGDVQSHSDFAPFAALLQGAGAAASNANTAAAAANAAASLAEQKAQAIPDDYSDLVADVAGKADKSTTYTKTQVDQMIADVEVETDTTLAVSGAPADSAETGRQIGLLKADLGAAKEESKSTVSYRFASEASEFEKLLAQENIGLNTIDRQMFFNALLDCLSTVVSDSYEGVNRLMVLQNNVYGAGLPRDYIKLNYIQSNGNLAIDTGIASTFALTIRAVYMENYRWTTISSGVVKESMGAVVSAGTGGNTRYYPLAVINGPTAIPMVGCRFGNNPWEGLIDLAKFESLVDQKVSMSVSNNTLMLVYDVNGERKNVSLDMENIALPSNNIFVFRNPEAFRNMMNKSTYWIRLYYLTISNGNNVLFDGVPCCYLPDGVCGLYNTVNDTFYPLVDYSEANS